MHEQDVAAPELGHGAVADVRTVDAHLPEHDRLHSARGRGPCGGLVVHAVRRTEQHGPPPERPLQRVGVATDLGLLPLLGQRPQVGVRAGVGLDQGVRKAAEELRIGLDRAIEQKQADGHPELLEGGLHLGVAGVPVVDGQEQHGIGGLDAGDHRRRAGSRRQRHERHRRRERGPGR
jgi:hypothetical protein